MVQSKYTPEERLLRKRMAARLRQQRCRARKRAAADAARQAETDGSSSVNAPIRNNIQQTTQQHTSSSSVSYMKGTTAAGAPYTSAYYPPHVAPNHRESHYCTIPSYTGPPVRFPHAPPGSRVSVTISYEGRPPFVMAPNISMVGHGHPPPPPPPPPPPHMPVKVSPPQCYPNSGPAGSTTIVRPVPHPLPTAPPPPPPCPTVVSRTSSHDESASSSVALSSPESSPSNSRKVTPRKKPRNTKATLWTKEKAAIDAMLILRTVDAGSEDDEEEAEDTRNKHENNENVVSDQQQSPIRRRPSVVYAPAAC